MTQLRAGAKLASLCQITGQTSESTTGYQHLHGGILNLNRLAWWWKNFFLDITLYDFDKTFCWAACSGYFSLVFKIAIWILTILTQDTLPQTETKAEDQKECYCSHRDQDSKCRANWWEKQRKPKTILEHLFSITISPEEYYIIECFFNFRHFYVTGVDFYKSFKKITFVLFL